MKWRPSTGAVPLDDKAFERAKSEVIEIILRGVSPHKLRIESQSQDRDASARANINSKLPSSALGRHLSAWRSSEDIRTR